MFVYNSEKLAHFVTSYPTGADKFIDEMKKVVARGEDFFPETKAAISIIMRGHFREQEMTRFENDPIPRPSVPGEVVVYWCGPDEAQGGKQVALIQGPGVGSAKLYLKYEHGFRWSYERGGFLLTASREAFFQILKSLEEFGYTVAPKRTSDSEHVFEEFPRYHGQKHISCMVGGALKYSVRFDMADSTIEISLTGGGGYRTLTEAKSALNAYLLDQAIQYLEYLAFVNMAGPKDLGFYQKTEGGVKRYEVVKNGLLSTVNCKNEGSFSTFAEAKADLILHLQTIHTSLTSRLSWLGTTTLTSFAKEELAIAS